MEESTRIYDKEVRKEPETIELELEGWQIGHFLPYPTVEEAKNYLKKCEFEA